ncbi:MAG: lipocalin [Alphaproteobacteria bacterium]|nr:lipocalin [Alphaproteobacteria bacterium]
MGKTILVGLLAGSFLVAWAGKPDGVTPVRGFDAAKYGGRWFEIMRLENSFERGLTNVTATYGLRPDGSLDVLNRGLDRQTCRWKEAHGHAVFQGERTVASLSVTFFWPFSGGYHVLALDKQNYAWALVSGPSRSYLWILARHPTLDPAILENLLEEARRLNFPVAELVSVDHGKPDCPAAE